MHTLDTEYGWRCLLQAQEDVGILEENDFADVGALEARWDVERAAWLGYVAALDDERLNRGNGEDPAQGLTVAQTIVHVVMHGIQHRSEVAAILTGYGHAPGELDFDLFLHERADSLGR